MMVQNGNMVQEPGQSLANITHRTEDNRSRIHPDSSTDALHYIHGPSDKESTETKGSGVNKTFDDSRENVPKLTRHDVLLVNDFELEQDVDVRPVNIDADILGCSDGRVEDMEHTTASVIVEYTSKDGDEFHSEKSNTAVNNKCDDKNGVNRDSEDNAQIGEGIGELRSEIASRVGSSRFDKEDGTSTREVNSGKVGSRCSEDGAYSQEFRSDKADSACSREFRSDKADSRASADDSSRCDGAQQAKGPPNIVLHQPDHACSTELEAHAKPGRLQLKLHPSTAEGGIQPARKSPVTVQEWVDSLPGPLQRNEDETEEQPLEDAEDVLDLGLGAEAGLLYDGCPEVTIISPQQQCSVPDMEIKVGQREGLAREQSVQSDVTSHGSHGSSVESYLESRKPDPEEVLLSLGFGGPGSSIDSEVSRIPRRFLQPSKVKGVAIKDFLRHQQDLIETFETGFCGYRGLTGSSHGYPSVIVAKIMEKLREHERESCHSGATSDNASVPASPPPETGKRFSNVAHRVLKRTSVLGAIPSRQASLSVLNADNRRFLENQGSKSPEVPRKRMIIGHRSFTFGCDGDLIEVETSSAAKASLPPLPPLPKPLVHKDSVLSSATSLSLTSMDSDSDTDDRSGSYELQRRMHPVVAAGTSTMETTPCTSTPYSNNQAATPNLMKIPAMSLDLGGEKMRTVRLSRSHSAIGKRMSSTSLSSWESDGFPSPTHANNSSPDSPFVKSRFSCGNDLETSDEQKFKGLKPQARFYLSSSTQETPTGVRPIRYESIDEDVEMKTGSRITEHCINDDLKQFDSAFVTVSPLIQNENEGDVIPESEESVFINSVPTSPISKSPPNSDSTNAQSRRGSLKRQQRVSEDEIVYILPSSSDVHDVLRLKDNQFQSKEEQLEVVEKGEIQQSLGEKHEKQECELEKTQGVIQQSVTKSDIRTQSLQEDSFHLKEEFVLKHPFFEVEENVSNLPLVSVMDKDICNQKVELTTFEELLRKQTSHTEEIGQLKQKVSSNSPHSGAFGLQLVDFLQVNKNVSTHLEVTGDKRGDSFEMEEIGIFEDEGRLATLSRTRSDSSGFLEGDPGEHSPSGNSADSREGDHKQVPEEKFNSDSTDALLTSASNSAAILKGDGVETNALGIDSRLTPTNLGVLASEKHRDDSSKVELGTYMKRLSLPVVCVLDECGSVLFSRSTSLHSLSSSSSSSSGSRAIRRKRLPRRRARSAPNTLSLAGSSSSVSNMFSSCESVIHVGLGVTSPSPSPSQEATESSPRSRELQELLDELAGRGVDLTTGLDSPSLACQPESQLAPLQADAVRLALGTYGSRLVGGASNLKVQSELLECGPEAQRELQVVREIRDQIVVELRRVAAMLEEQPEPRAIAITRQMTDLLREQTRLYCQLEALSHSPADPSVRFEPLPCCNSEILLQTVREENGRLERLVEGHSRELAEIRELLRELVAKQR